MATTRKGTAPKPAAPTEDRKAAAPRRKRSASTKTQSTTPIQQLQFALCSLLVRMSEVREAAAAAAPHYEYCEELRRAGRFLEGNGEKSSLAKSAAASRLRRLESALTELWLAMDVAHQTLAHASPQIDGIHRGSALAPSAELKGILIHIRASLYRSDPQDIQAVDEWDRRCQLASMAAGWREALAQPQERLAAWYERVMGASLLGDTMTGEWLTVTEAGKRLSEAEGCDHISEEYGKVLVSREADRRANDKPSLLVTNGLTGTDRLIEANSLSTFILEHMRRGRERRLGIRTSRKRRARAR